MQTRFTRPAWVAHTSAEITHLLAVLQLFFSRSALTSLRTAFSCSNAAFFHAMILTTTACFRVQRFTARCCRVNRSPQSDTFTLSNFANRFRMHSFRFATRCRAYISLLAYNRTLRLARRNARAHQSAHSFHCATPEGDSASPSKLPGRGSGISKAQRTEDAEPGASARPVFELTGGGSLTQSHSVAEHSPFQNASSAFQRV